VTERTTVRPTVFGLVVGLVLVVGVALRPPTADPSVTGLVAAALLGAWVLGVIWPVLVLRNLGLAVRRAPTDLVVGQLGSVELELAGRASGLALACTGSGVTVVDVSSPGTVRLPLTIAARGVYRRLLVDVASDAPFGIVWVRRTRLVELPDELLVAPVPEATRVPAQELAGHDHVSVPMGSADRGEVVRSVRPYVVGDPAHLVHWPTSAHAGALVVRELEPPTVEGVALVLDLGTGGLDPVEVERVVARAAGAASDLLDRGARVVLCSHEATGPVTGEVTDYPGVRRRLARAVAGPAGLAPEGWPSQVLAATASTVPADTWPIALGRTSEAGRSGGNA
jgi:uncharacterized protein (DUF58 family)